MYRNAEKSLNTLLNTMKFKRRDQMLNTSIIRFTCRGIKLGLWCLSHFQQYFSYIVACLFYCWRKPEYLQGITTNLLQVTDKLYHIILYRVHLAWAGFELTTLVVIGTDYIGSYKSNYHTITTTMVPYKGIPYSSIIYWD